MVNVLDCLPTSAQPAARKALAQIRDGEDREHAEKAVTGFAAAYKAKYPKAVAKITGDQEQLLAFYGFPAEHWIHLKTSNPIESTFATVRLRTRVTKGPGSRAAGLAMVFKLIEAAGERWRYVNGPHLAALVRAGASSEGSAHRAARRGQDQGRRVINQDTPSTTLDHSSPGGGGRSSGRPPGCRRGRSPSRRRRRGRPGWFGFRGCGPPRR